MFAVKALTRIWLPEQKRDCRRGTHKVENTLEKEYETVEWVLSLLLFSAKRGNCP